jgi:uncharacterized membrane protein YdjX (TVP38/TMEM64 family)
MTFVALIVSGRVLYLKGVLDLDSIHAFLRIHPVSAVFIFIVFYVCFVSLVLPTLPFNLGAGFLWGTFWGGTFASLGSILGAVLAFLLARTLLGQPLRRRYGNRMLRWLQSNLNENGWIVVGFVRMNPVFPGAVNILFGLSSIRFGTYFWATAVFLLPPTFCFAYAGTTLNHWITGGEPVQLVREVMILSGCVIAITLLALALKFQLQRARSHADRRSEGAMSADAPPVSTNRVHLP